MSEPPGRQSAQEDAPADGKDRDEFICSTNKGDGPLQCLRKGQMLNRGCKANKKIGPCNYHGRLRKLNKFLLELNKALGLTLVDNEAAMLSSSRPGSRSHIRTHPLLLWYQREEKRLKDDPPSNTFDRDEKPDHGDEFIATLKTRYIDWHNQKYGEGACFLCLASPSANDSVRRADSERHVDDELQRKRREINKLDAEIKKKNESLNYIVHTKIPSAHEDFQELMEEIEVARVELNRLHVARRAIQARERAVLQKKSELHARQQSKHVRKVVKQNGKSRRGHFMAAPSTSSSDAQQSGRRQVARKEVHRVYVYSDSSDINHNDSEHGENDIKEGDSITGKSGNQPSVAQSSGVVHDQGDNGHVGDAHEKDNDAVDGKAPVGIPGAQFPVAMSSGSGGADGKVNIVNVVGEDVALDNVQPMDLDDGPGSGDEMDDGDGMFRNVRPERRSPDRQVPARSSRKRTASTPLPDAGVRAKKSKITHGASGVQTPGPLDVSFK